jgi:sodium transport system permease protein
MSWRIIRLIYAREILDQFRDRRTVFMIAVLPLLLYPLLGMTVFQLSQFMRKHEARVVIVGAEQLEKVPNLPPLFEDGHFAPDTLGDPAWGERITLEFAPPESGKLIRDTTTKGLAQMGPDTESDRISSYLTGNGADVVVVFPPDFAARLADLRKQLGEHKPVDAEATTQSNIRAIPEPEILYNSSSDESRLTHMWLESILEQWRGQVTRQNLRESNVPVNITRPFTIKPLDIAAKQQRDAVLWSKILPFVLFVWALTGAFYPSIDLCPGEKERGTLETLLSSPALRAEIVWAKLLTIMTFSIATALLNLLSLGVTAQYVISQLRGIAEFGTGDSLSFPSLIALFWLVVALIPMAALFSGLCLACAAFARSTKEGQYYFMPLFMITMPLMILPMAPGVELELGNCLIPVTGMVLLLRSLIEGHYAAALPYVLPVAGITFLCVLLAIRWAIELFQQESVLFRESERLDLRRWITHLVRDRRPTPRAAQAFTCVALIFVIQFFFHLAISANVPAEPGFSYFALVIFISQVVSIALPAVFMTIVLTSRPWQTLLLDKFPSISSCVVALMLAGFLHPVGQQLAIWISQLYPVSDDVVASSQAMVKMLQMAPYAWLPFVLIAMLPAICEELAFRGFILSGFRHLGHKWWAIGLSAVFFGLAHTVLQQSLAAIVVGVVLGFLAIQTSSLVPCMLFHMTYNGLMFFSTQWTELAGDAVSKSPILRWVLTEAEPGQVSYSRPVVIVCALLAGCLLYWLGRLPYKQTEEERLQELRARQQRPDDVAVDATSGN